MVPVHRGPRDPYASSLTSWSSFRSPCLLAVPDRRNDVVRCSIRTRSDRTRRRCFMVFACKTTPAERGANDRKNGKPKDSTMTSKHRQRIRRLRRVKTRSSGNGFKNVLGKDETPDSNSGLGFIRPHFCEVLCRRATAVVGVAVSRNLNREKTQRERSERPSSRSSNSGLIRPHFYDTLPEQDGEQSLK